MKTIQPVLIVIQQDDYLLIILKKMGITPSLSAGPIFPPSQIPRHLHMSRDIQENMEFGSFFLVIDS